MILYFAVEVGRARLFRARVGLGLHSDLSLKNILNKLGLS
jgi:hypothetical protein